tara:strand:+ start:259 stop:828 length:570 start_codon:yes stop_codon:yes gene_type:complete
MTDFVSDKKKATSILIDKKGTMTEILIKNDSIEYLSKKCGFKTEKHFEPRTQWNVKLDKTYNILLYAKNDGRANSENKYDFPPPVDTSLFFGTCLLVNYFENKISSLSIKEWEQIYEKLFGGFENLKDCAEEDEEEEDELDMIPDENKTKDGYLLDGFVVDDDSSSLHSSYDEDSELSEEAYVYTDEEK